MPTIAPSVWLKIVLVASLVVPGAVLGMTAWRSRQHAIEAAERQIATTVSLLREQTERVLQSEDLALDLVDRATRGLDWDEINTSAAVRMQLLALLHKLPQLASIGVVSRDGQGSIDNLTDPHQRLDVADRDYFMTLRDDPALGTFVSHIIMGRISHRLLFNIARRRRAADGRFDGVIALSIEPTYLGDFYQTFAGPPGMAIALVRDDGAMLARYPPLTAPVDLPADDDLLVAARQHDAGSLRRRSAIDGTKRLVGFARVEGYPLLVAYGISSDGVLAGWVGESLVYGSLTAAASVALALMTWFAMRGLAAVADGRRQLEVANADLAHQIAERSRAEAALRELNSELEQRVASRTASLAETAAQLERERIHQVSFIEASPFAELLVDPNGTILMTNVAAEKLFGYQHDELISQPIETLLPQGFRQGHPDLRDGFFAPATARPMGTGLDVLAVRKDGGEVAVEVLLSPLQTPAGPATIVGVADISTRRQAQSALLSANADLITANQELLQANITVRLKSEEVESFVYIVSHDLRAPLINLQGFARELARGCTELREILMGLDLPEPTGSRIATLMDQDINGSLPYITASVAKFDRLINALIDLSRTGRYPLHPAPIDIGAVVLTTLDALRHLIEEAEGIVVLRSLPPAIADATAVGQIFANLIGNAVKFAAPDRTVQIEIGGEAGEQLATYWVRDNGRGIPPHARTRLFQMFQRFHSSVTNGDGIGLATVKHLVERQGGTVWVENEANGGSTFKFTLPVEQAKEAA